MSARTLVASTNTFPTGETGISANATFMPDQEWLFALLMPSLILLFVISVVALLSFAVNVRSRSTLDYLEAVIQLQAEDADVEDGAGEGQDGQDDQSRSETSFTYSGSDVKALALKPPNYRSKVPVIHPEMPTAASLRGILLKMDDDTEDVTDFIPPGAEEPPTKISVDVVWKIPSKMPEYMLCYFEARGRGEHIRYIFNQAGVSYKENHIKIEDWPDVKARTPFGQVPVLHVDDKKLTQSTAIARYLAKQFGLVPDDDLQQAECDMYVASLMDDLYASYTPVYKAKGMGNLESLEVEWQVFRDGPLRVFLDRFEKILAANGTGFLVGDKLSWADLTVAEFLERFQSCYEKDVLHNHPKLAEHVRMVHALPNIKAYVEKRPKMEI